MADIFLIQKHWVTEKATDLNTIGKYVFMVKPEATKSEIKKAVKELYKVDVTNVNVVNRPSRMKRFRNTRVRTGAYRKAIVTIKEGQKIDIVR
jgi:large subunit ribosomal protein L23